MKRIPLLICLCLTRGFFQAASQEPIATTVCSIAREPAAFAGKLVKLRATIETGFEISSVVEPDKSCDRRFWLSFGVDRNEDQGYVDDRDNELQKKQPVILEKNEGNDALDEALKARVYPTKPDVFCGYGCPRFRVTALLTGRLDYARDGESGFGHMNMARIRLMVGKISDVTTEDIPYDWNKFSRSPPAAPAHGFLTGKLTDHQGNPIAFARVEAIPPEGAVPISNPEELTKEDGTFSIEVSPGKYLVVVNRTSPATKKVPSGILYAASTERRERAQTYSVADRQTVSGVELHLQAPPASKYIYVHVQWPDGKPVDDANVMVAEAPMPDAIAGDAEDGVSYTGPNGDVTMLAFAGREYRLTADIYKKPGYVPYCDDVYAIPADFRDGLAVTMTLQRQSETCRGQDGEHAKPLPKAK